MKKEKLAYEIQHDGLWLKGWYLEKPNNGDALIEICKDDKILESYKVAAYKIYNYASHADDILESYKNSDNYGLSVASSDGLGGHSSVEKLK